MGRLRHIFGRYSTLTTLIVVNFFFSLHQFSIAVTNSSLLGQFFNPQAVSLVFALASFVVIGALLLAPLAIRTIGVWRLLILLIPIAQLAVLLLGFAQSALQAALFLIIQTSVFFFLSYLIDLYFESVVTDESQTGNLRAVFLVTGMVAITIAPLLVTLTVINDFYLPLYALSALALAPAFFVAIHSLKKLHPHKPDVYSPLKALTSLHKCAPNVARVLGANFVFQLFIIWIIIYTPLYMHDVGGLSWQFIGIVILLAHLPYLILEIPIGFLADYKIGEKELMILGFVIMSVCFVAIAYIPIANLVLWVTAFIALRIGAAMVHITTESYFFKHVDDSDSAYISFFRIMAPIGGIVGPVIAFLFLPFTGLQFLFAVFGAIMLAGIPFALALKDTR